MRLSRRKDRTMFAFIEYLRAIATMLVANSHFKGIYPWDILAFGGGFGLALFYLISGYVMSNISENTRFFDWYIKKVTRLYIPLWIFRMVELGTGFLEIDAVGKLLQVFVFPATWFSASMVLIYPIYYVFVKKIYPRFGKVAIWVASVGLMVALVGQFVLKPQISYFSLETLKVEERFSLETPYLITQLLWIACMLTGFYLRRSGEKPPKNYTKVFWVVAWFACVLIFLFAKLVTSDGKSMNLQILLVPAYWGFAYFLFQIFRDWEKKLSVVNDTIPGRVLRIISMCSLEIYYVQFIWIKAMREIRFPANWLLLVICIVVTAFCLNKISGKLNKRIWQKTNNTR